MHDSHPKIEQPFRPEAQVDTELRLSSDDHLVTKTEATDECKRSDAGIRAYLTVLGAFFNLFAVFGQLNAFGTYQLWYGEHQLSNSSASDISWIGSLQLWTFFLSGGIVGQLFDAYGPRRLIFIGGLLFTLSLMLTSLSSHYYQFLLAQGLLQGIAAGIQFYPCLSAVSTHFVRYRATAMGIAFAGSGCGGIVFPILMSNLFPTVGFNWTVRICGFISLACSTISFLTVTSQLPPQKPNAWFDLSSLKDKTYMALTSGTAILCFGFYVPYYYLVQYSQARGISQKLSFDTLSVLNASSIIGRILLPVIADALGRFNTYIPCCFIAGISCLSIWLTAHNVLSIMWFAVLYGIFGGAIIALTGPCAVQISKPEQAGVRIGTLYSFLSVPTLVGEPIAGALLSRQGGEFSGMIIFTGVSLIAGGFSILSARIMLNSKLWARL